MIWPSTQHGPLSIALSGLVEKWLVVVPYGGCSTGPGPSHTRAGNPHGTPCLFPQGEPSRTVHLACSPRGTFPHGAPCLFPQGNASRTSTPSRSPRGSLPVRYTLLPPGERFPHGHAFPYGLPVPVIRTIVPENKTPQNGPETGTQKWKIGITFPQRGSLPSIRRLALSHWFAIGKMLMIGFVKKDALLGSALLANNFLGL